MQISRRAFLLSGAASVLVPRFASAARPRRSESYFGLHFDLHPTATDTVLGRDVSEEMIASLLKRVKPDYVQYDCKGHPGWAGYATRIGSPSPGITRDSLAVWRKLTAANNVSLYIHYSGIWDARAIELHPEWALVDQKGRRDANLTSPFGPYVDQLLIPQIKEAAELYDLDGVWIDGECWAIKPDFSDIARERFQQATGKRAPDCPDDSTWGAYLEFNRQAFRDYIRHYCDEIHKSRPDFQIASNWLYSTMVPERPDLPVDFISGDYLGNASISTARLEARFMSAQKKPWDLMAWGFQSDGKQFNHKPAVQLQQEASTVLAQGGGFQVYYALPRGGYIDQTHVATLERVAAFCRKRQELVHKTSSVPQIGVFFSQHTLYHSTNKLFGGWGSELNPVRGFVDALIDLHYSTDVIPEWREDSYLQSFPLIVLPEWRLIGESSARRLRNYVLDGGNLLVAGAENVGLFADLLDVSLKGAPTNLTAFVKGGDQLGNVSGRWQDVEAGPGAKVAGIYFPAAEQKDGRIAAVLKRAGKGNIGAVFGSLGSCYAAYHSPAVREFIGSIVKELFTPLIELNAPHCLEVALRRKGDTLLAQIINCSGMQVAADYAAIDYIPPVGAFEVSLRLEREPVRVRLEPEGISLLGSWENGIWRGTIPGLSIFATLAIQF